MLDENLNTFAERLIYIMDKNGYSHNDVARMCNVRQGSISYIIANNLDKSKLSLDIAKGLNISHDWLTTGNGSPAEDVIYKIPIMYNAIECLDFIKNKKPSNINFLFIYSKRDELSNECFALNHKSFDIICSTNLDQTSNLNRYLNINDILSDEFEISDCKNGIISFPIMEIRIYKIDGDNDLKLGI